MHVFIIYNCIGRVSQQRDKKKSSSMLLKLSLGFLSTFNNFYNQS